jgi:hypothetical protein
MPTLAFHSNYWQTQAVPPPGDPATGLPVYPTWQMTILTTLLLCVVVAG